MRGFGRGERIRTFDLLNPIQGGLRLFHGASVMDRETAVHAGRTQRDKRWDTAQRGTAPSRTWRLTPTGYASEDPTTRAAWMVQGETDAGPQRRCVACRQWWPLEKDHWVRRPRAKGRTGYIQPCKACRVENGMADS